MIMPVRVCLAAAVRPSHHSVIIAHAVPNILDIQYTNTTEPRDQLGRQTLVKMEICITLTIRSGPISTHSLPVTIG